MKRYLEKPHAKDAPLDRAWNIVEFLEKEARDYITNKSEAERDTDEKSSRYWRVDLERDLTRFKYNSSSARAISPSMKNTFNTLTH